MRRTLRRLRAEVSDRTEREVAIVGRIDEILEMRRVDVVAAYAAAGGEVSVDHAIERSWDAGRTVTLPLCVDDNGLRWLRLGRYDELAAGRHGVREPSAAIRRDPGRAVAAADIGTVLVPGVGFGPDGRRLGQGGGYYDRFLATWGEEVGDRGVSIGVAFDVQVVDDLPAEPHDRSVDFIATESRLIDCRAARSR